MRTIAAVIGFVMLAATGRGWAADVYTYDPVHSSVEFAVRHMMVAKVTGVFTDCKMDIAFSADDLANSRFDMTIQPASVNTRNEDRDNHLRSADFFDVAAYPLITFRTKKIEKTDANQYLVTGDLTMKAVTKEVAIPVTVYGPVPNPMVGGDGIGIEASFMVNRQDYGVNWNKVLDNGGVAISDEVQVNVNVEAHRAAM